MKKTIILLAAFMTIACVAAAQTYNLVVFSGDGENFYAFVNGVKQNEKALSNVKITGLNSEALNVRLEFENKALPKLKQNMMPEPGFEHTIRIKKSMKGEFKMQYFGKVAIADAPKSGASEVAYHTSDNSSSNSNYNTSSNSSSNNNDSFNQGGNTTVTTTSTTTQISGEPESVFMNVGVNGINVNVNTGTGTQGSVKSTTTKTVTTSTSSTYNTNTSTSTNANPRTQTQTQAIAADPNKGGCSAAMSEASYAKMKKSIEDKPFSDTKMSTAKLATKGNCLSVAQVKGICALFSMDEEKLTYAKYAYDHSMEKGNYYQVSEIFSFSATTDDFNKFLEAK